LNYLIGFVAEMFGIYVHCVISSKEQGNYTIEMFMKLSNM